MQFIHEFIISISLIVMGLIAIYAFKYRRVSGAYPLFIQMTAAAIWALGSLLEIGSIGLDTKILWRNVQQIGVFVIPISNVLFAVDYTKQNKLRKYVYILSIIPITALLLIFTNEYHHLMRSGYVLVDNNLPTKALVTTPTIFGILFIAFNYLFQVLTILILFDFSRRVSGKFRKQVYMVIMSIILTFFLSWFRSTYLQQRGIYVPIAVLYIPSAIILFYSVFRYRIFNISPIARDKVFDIINEGIIVVDQEGNIVDLNRYAISLLNKFVSLRTDIIGEKIGKVFSNFVQISEMISDKQEEIKEIHSNSGKNSCYMSVGVYPLSANDRENQVGAVIIVNDITQKKMYELGLKAMAERDGLTGLLNRRGFSDTFNKLLQNIEIKSQPVTVFMIDIDLFKNINDTYGHTNGDKVIQHFAEILKNALRSEDVVGRVGGEEFAVVLPDINKNDAFGIAERIRRKVEESNLLITEDKVIKYTISIGIADNSEEEISQEKLLHWADMALYEAKETSRNHTTIYNN